jgi:2-phospho-L-lactate/phosphoenolpyruvate guanylyltransferase
MTTVVVPFAGSNGKTRLEAPPDVRRELSLAMLSDVLAAAAPLGDVVVATNDGEALRAAGRFGAATASDPGGGQGAAVAAALAGVGGLALVVNADLPCAAEDDLRALAAAVPAGGLALVEARDGTTNALGLSAAALFAPLYGPGSAARFRARGAVPVDLPNLADDVDTVADLERVLARCGAHTHAALAAGIAR